MTKVRGSAVRPGGVGGSRIIFCVRSEMPIGFSGGNSESVGVSLEIREELRAGGLWES